MWCSLQWRIGNGVGCACSGFDQPIDALEVVLPARFGQHRLALGRALVEALIAQSATTWFSSPISVVK